MEDRLSHLHPSEINEAPENPREISSERFAALRYALEADPGMMEARPIIVDARNGEVVCGNMRLRAARELGWEKVPVYLKVFRDDAQRREWMLRDNQEYGTWVPDELAALVQTHEAAGADMSLLGFSQQEIDDLKSIGELSPDMPDSGDAGTDDVHDVYAIVIDCTDEDQQLELLEEFEGRGLKSRALMV
jgi:hypothetical protein